MEGYVASECTKARYIDNQSRRNINDHHSRLISIPSITTGFSNHGRCQDLECSASTQRLPAEGVGRSTNGKAMEGATSLAYKDSLRSYFVL